MAAELFVVRKWRERVRVGGLHLMGLHPSREEREKGKTVQKERKERQGDSEDPF